MQSSSIKTQPIQNVSPAAALAAKKAKGKNKTADKAQRPKSGRPELVIFGQRLKQLREQHNLSAYAVATACEITTSQIRAYEKGLREPSVFAASKLAKFFAVDIEQLID